MHIFAKVRYLCKRLRTATTPGRDLWDTIAIVIALDSLHDDFNTTTASLFDTGDKTIDQIQSILHSKDAKNISKRKKGAVGDLAMSFRNNNRSQKKKATNGDKYFNCHNLVHFGRDYPIPNKQYSSDRSHTPNPRGMKLNRGRNRGGHGRGRNSNNSRVPDQAN